jgi:hypothetical protein
MRGPRRKEKSRESCRNTSNLRPRGPLTVRAVARSVTAMANLVLNALQDAWEAAELAYRAEVEGYMSLWWTDAPESFKGLPDRALTRQALDRIAALRHTADEARTAYFRAH